MANIFERVRDYLNQPLPGAPGSKPPAKAKTAPKPKTSSSTTKGGSAKTSPPKPDAQQKAPDVQAQMRKREMDLRRAQAKANADERKRLAKERAELEALRRRYQRVAAETSLSVRSRSIRGPGLTEPRHEQANGRRARRGTAGQPACSA